MEYDPTVIVATARGIIRQGTPGLTITAATLILGGIGFLRAVEEAAYLRFHAHTLLCQVEIERHLSTLAGSSGE